MADTPPTTPEPAAKHIEQMDKAPPDQQPPNWKDVRALMMREPPKVGDAAPDFELKTLDGKETVKLSQFAGKLPVVLVFGSDT